MTTTEKKPRAKKLTAADTIAKLRQTAIDLAPPSLPELAFVPLDLIDCIDQVRTEFDQEALQNLADDIKARGVLQPVLLRKKDDGRFLMIAGERRLRASRLADVPAIPAIVGVVDDTAAEDMQLAENIQREDLTLAETVAAVRRLFDRLGSLQAVADRVHKSKSWVSKRVTLSCDDVHWYAKNLLESGECEDIETLNALSQVFRTNYAMGHELAEMIERGEAGRATAREYVTKAKERREEIEAAREAVDVRNEEDRKAAVARRDDDMARAANERYELHKVRLRARFSDAKERMPDFLNTVLALIDDFGNNDEDLESWFSELVEALQLHKVGVLFEVKP